MWIKTKDLQDMLEDAKRAGFNDGEMRGRIEGRRRGYAEGEDAANRAMRSAGLNNNLNDAALS